MSAKYEFPALPPVLDNPYWDRVKQFVSKERDFSFGTYVIGGLDRNHRITDAYNDAWKLREEVTREYAWTITSPQTVQFVAEHCTGRVLDPLAGTGYWGFLLRQFGIQVNSSDLHPPAVDEQANNWHFNTSTFVPVLKADAVDAATMSDTGDTLFLSWPPHLDPIGFKTLSAFAGNRLILISEGPGGSTGDDDFFAVLGSEWTVREEHAPVQFWGIHDYVSVYDRNQPADSS